MFYKRKALQLEAVQYLSLKNIPILKCKEQQTNFVFNVEIEFSNYPDWLIKSVEEKIIFLESNSVKIKILHNNIEGQFVEIKPTDWIIKGIGEDYHLYPCSDKNFKQLYEKVDISNLRR